MRMVSPCRRMLLIVNARPEPASPEAAAFLVRIPVAILMRRVPGTLFGIGLGVPVATVFQILACFVFLGHLNRKQVLKRQAA